MKTITLAYPWTDPEGTEHAPDTPGEVDPRTATLLLGSGRAREAQPGPFDPSQHNVTDVLAYLQAADGAERTRVLDAERAGQARVSVIGKPTTSEETS